jgi:hypothetical protein
MSGMEPGRMRPGSSSGSTHRMARRESQGQDEPDWMRARKLVSPGREDLPARAVMLAPAARLCWPEVRYSARGSCKPNSVVCGHSSRRRVAADVHQRPTRRFRTLRGASLRRRAGTGHESRSELTPPSLFGLAPCGVYPASDVTAGAVRSCRTISPLPRH